jgi:hypothetical protein
VVERPTLTERAEDLPVGRSHTATLARRRGRGGEEVRQKRDRSVKDRLPAADR